MRRKVFDRKFFPERRRGMILACILFWSIISFFGISRYVIQSAEVLGESMQPTMFDGDRFMVLRTAYLFRDPRPGEIIAVVTPGDSTPSVKRVIALPGDLVRIGGGHVFVNDVKLYEPYLAFGTYTQAEALGPQTRIVSRDCFFVLGDNREVSADSRMFGAFRREHVLGRILPQPGPDVDEGDRQLADRDPAHTRSLL
jgi:signal peptidase I